VVKGATGDTPQAFTLEVAAPNQTGPFSFRAHAVIDGTDVFSDLKTVTVESASAFTLTLSTDKVVIDKQSTISQGVPITVTVTSAPPTTADVAVLKFGPTNVTAGNAIVYTIIGFNRQLFLQ
jgi:uncharacterized secreted protein with C-terminal beta-propeller domain